MKVESDYFIWNLEDCCRLVADDFDHSDVSLSSCQNVFVFHIEIFQEFYNKVSTFFMQIQIEILHFKEILIQKTKKDKFILGQKHQGTQKFK